MHRPHVNLLLSRRYEHFDRPQNVFELGAVLAIVVKVILYSGLNAAGEFVHFFHEQLQ